jgi:TetR/AcrR family transcriptional repressor of bet genes
VSGVKKRTKGRATAPRARSTNSRQRQRLIEACISALHEFGPSRTTVEKVVAIAKMSPGIVRFYFDSKAAMLVASLQFLAAEFEERLLSPVALLEDRPVAALELLVDLYLDPDLASPRKVSVWYAFWGEASSRQEYYDICGQKDERFAALVRRLIERLIADTRQSQLDPDGIALGLIGVLEILWQGFAFQTEVSLDRAAAKHRCMAYLRSIFPGEFPPGRVSAAAPEPATDGKPLPRWSYDDPTLHSEERAVLFAGTWQIAGLAAEIAAPSTYLAADLGTERALLVRDASGVARAFRDSCPVTPHRLSSRERGVLSGVLECRLHGLRFALDGLAIERPASGGLAGMDLQILGNLLFVRASGAEPPTALRAAWFSTRPPSGDEMLGSSAAAEVHADWKVVVEQWLTSLFPDDAERPAVSAWEFAELELPAAAAFKSAASEAVPPFIWHARLARPPTCWTSARYLRLCEGLASDEDVSWAADARWQRVFLPPNQLIERRPDGLSIWQVVPVSAARSRVRRFDQTFCATPRLGRNLRRLADRLAPALQPPSLESAASIQQGLVALGYEADERGAPLRAQAAFRSWLRRRIPALRRERTATARANSL